MLGPPSPLVAEPSMAACLVLRRAGSVRRAVVLAGILLAGFCSPGMVVISRVLIVLRRESARDWVRSGREFLRLMVRAGAVVDNIWVVSADIGELGRSWACLGESLRSCRSGRDPQAVR